MSGGGGYPGFLGPHGSRLVSPFFTRTFGGGLRGSESIHNADPCSIALTGGDISLLPNFGGVMVRSLMLSPGVSHVCTARDNSTGALVGFTIFALPGQLMCST